MLPIYAVLCAFDASDASSGALVLAADLAERHHATLHLVHVNPLFRARMAHAGDDPEAAFRDQTRGVVDAALGEGAFDVVGPALHRSHGETPADGIVRWASELDADLVVVGTHGRRGAQRLLAGSVAAEVLRRAAVPVLVVPERAERTAPSPDRPVLAGVDFSDHTAPVLRLARDLAEAYGAPLAVAHARDVPPDTLVGPARRPLSPPTGLASREEASRALADALAGAGLAPASVEQHVAPGRPVATLVGVAGRARAGALVVGTHGRSGWERLRLGSVAEGVVREAPCPVVVVPPAEARDARREESAPSRDATET